MFVSFLAIGGRNLRLEESNRASIIHISLMTRKYYLVPAPWLSLNQPDRFYGNWILNMEGDMNLVTAVGCKYLHEVNLNQNIHKIKMTNSNIQGYTQVKESLVVQRPTFKHQRSQKQTAKKNSNKNLDALALAMEH
jgi:hypothetical protein